MNTQKLQGRWKELKGGAKERWARLTDDDLKQVEGQADQLVGKIEQRYGVTKDEARSQVEQFCAAS